MNQDEYNGWTNYETWVAALWMQNDSGSCDYYAEITNEYDSVYDLSKALQDEFEENNPLPESGVYADLMTAAISEINFYEIAEHFWEDYKEVDEEEEGDDDE